MSLDDQYSVHGGRARFLCCPGEDVSNNGPGKEPALSGSKCAALFRSNKLLERKTSSNASVFFNPLVPTTRCGRAFLEARQQYRRDVDGAAEREKRGPRQRVCQAALRTAAPV